MNTPVEAAEIENPVMIERYEFIPDSGGAGKHRGGLSLRRDIRFLTDVTWARYSDRQKFKPLGLFGGREGTTGALILNPGTPGEKRCKSKGVDQLKTGDVLSIRLPGSGGYGPPAERAPEQVRWDVINGKVSLGIVFDREMCVDMEGTKILRSQASESKGSPEIDQERR